jgi:hypothetical protein
MKNTLILFILFSITTASTAQISGYLGKKISVEGLFHISPSYFGPTVNDRGTLRYDEDNGIIGLNCRFGAIAGYAITRGHQLFLEGNYSATGVVIENVPSIYIEPDGDERELSNRVFFALHTFSIEAGSRFFIKLNNGIAPLGSYMGVSLGVNRTKAIEKEREVMQNFTGDDPGELLYVPQFAYPFFSLSAGKTSIFSDVLILDFGIWLDVPLSGPGNSYEDEGRLKQEAFHRMIKHNIFSFHLGAGIVF